MIASLVRVTKDKMSIPSKKKKIYKIRLRQLVGEMGVCDVCVVLCAVRSTVRYSMSGLDRYRLRYYFSPQRKDKISTKGMEVNESSKQSDETPSTQTTFVSWQSQEE